MKFKLTMLLLTLCTIGFSQVTVIQSGDVGIKETNPKTELNVNGILSFNTNSFPPVSNGSLGLSIGVFNALPGNSWGGRIFTTSPGLSNKTGNGALVLQGPSASGAEAGISFYTGFPSTERMVLNHAGTLFLDRNLVQTFNGTSNIIIQPNNYYNTSLSGGANIIMGLSSGASLTSGSSNFLMGQYAGHDLQTGTHNVLLATSAGRYKVSGDYSVGIGPDALRNSNGSNNIGIGRIAGVYQQGSHNISMGQSAGQGGTEFDEATETHVPTNTSSYNIWLGYQSGMGTTNGGFNIGLGHHSLFSNTSGANNVALGRSSLKLNTSGTENIAIGKDAGQKSSGSHNVFLGAFSGYNSAGNKNVLIGYEAGRTETGSNKLYIESSSSTEPLIYGEFDNKKVGIGTSSPTATLDVNGGVNMKGGNAANSFVMDAGASFPKMRLQSGVVATYLSHNFQGFTPYEQDVSAHPSWQMGISGHTGGDYFKVLRSPVGSTTMVDMMVLKGNGKLGVGVSNPSEVLEVGGNTKVNGDIIVTNTSSLGTMMKLTPLSSDPTGPQSAGTVYYNSSDNTLRFFNGTEWKTLQTN